MFTAQHLPREALISAARKAAWMVTLLALAAGLALAPLRWTLLSAIGVGVGLAVLLRSWLGLLLIAVAVPFGPLLPLPVGTAAADVNELLVVGIVTAWLAGGVARRAIVIPHPPLLVPMLLLLGAYLASLPGAWSLQDGLIETSKWIEGLVVYLMVVALLPRRRTPWLIGALIVAGAAEAALGLYQFVRAIGPSQFAVLGRFVRAYGTFRQPNPFGGYMGLIAPVAISLAWWALAQTWQQWRSPGRWWQVARLTGLAVATGMTTLGLIASWSRGAWLGFVAAIATIVIARGPRAVAAVTVGLLVILAAAQISGYAGGNVAAALASRLADLQDYATITDPRVVEITDANFPIVQRQAQWWAAWGMFSDHPWLGVGIGNYAVAYPDYTLPRWYEPLGHAHNYYLNVAAETGLIGLAAYELAGLATFVWVGRQVRRLRGWPQAFAIGVMGVLVHLTVHNLFDNLYVQHMILHLALLLGIIVTLSSRWQESSQSS